MKRFIGRYTWAIALLVVAGSLLFLGSAPVSAEQSSFGKLRRQMPEKLDLLRERVNKAGGEEISLALLLASQNEDAHTVGTTVWVYQQYPRERKLAVLLAAAIKYHQEISLMQQVDDKSLKQALLQAPEEMAGINGMFQTVLSMLSMTDEQLQEAVKKAQTWNMSGKTAEMVRRTVQYNLGQKLE